MASRKTKGTRVRLSARLQRKDPRLPVYVVIAGRHVKPWGLAGTTVVEGTANGFPIGRRTIKAWGKETDDWFMEFTTPFCRTARLNVGDSVVLDLQVADTAVPKELESFLAESKNLAGAWQGLSERWRRDAGEYIRAAKAQATRERRAAKIAGMLQRRG
jgi:ribosomal protein L39E